jgi:hypothetical protein
VNRDNIERVVERSKGNDQYSKYTIGITEDWFKRKGELGDPPGWDWWLADNEYVARNVQKHFLDKGMKEDTGGGQSPKYVYIFKK